MDVLFTIAYCVAGYSSSEVVAWAPKLWDSLKYEVWNGENSEAVAGSLSVIGNIAKALSHPTSDWNDIENPSAKSLLSIINECNRRIIDTKPENMAKTGSILHSIAEASPYAFFWVARRFLPVMLTLWQDLTEESTKSVLLTILNAILEARVAVDAELDETLTKERTSSSGEQPLTTQASQSKDFLASSLKEYQRNLIDDVYFSAMTANISTEAEGIEYRAATIKGLVVMMSTRNMLSDFEKGTIIESLNSTLLQPDQNDTIQKEAVSALQKMSSGEPENFQKITLTNFMNKLPKSISIDKTQRKSELDGVISLLDSLVQISCAAICDSEENKVEDEHDPRDRVFTALQKALVSKLTTILECDGQLQYANIILGAIYQGLLSYDGVLDLGLKSPSPEKFALRNSQHHPYAWITMELYKPIAKVQQQEGGLPYVGLSLKFEEDEQARDKFVSLVGNITTLTLRSRQTTTENNFLNNLESSSPNSPSQIWSLFVEDAPGSIDDSQMDLTDGPAEKSMANVLSMALVAGVRREVGSLN